MTKQNTLLYTLILLLFVALFTMLCFQSRLATDDYWYIWNVNKYGIVKCVGSQYMGWCGRYVSEFMRYVLYRNLQINQTWYFLFPLTSIILLVCGVQKALGGITNYLHFSIPLVQKWLASLSFSALLFFLSIDKGECWFWYNALNDYLLCIVAFVWGVGFLFQTQYVLASYFGIIVCMIYTGGGSEVFSAIFSLIATFYLIICYRKAGSFSAFVSSTINKKLVVFYFALTLAFLVVVVAPGNYARASLLPPSNFFYSFVIATKSCIKFIVLFVPPQLPYIIAFLVLFLLIGKGIKVKHPNLFAPTFQFFLFRLTMFFTLVIFIFFFVIAYLMVEAGPARVWLLGSFLLTMYLCLVAFYAGYSEVLKTKIINALTILSFGFGISFMLFHLINQYSIVTKYSSALDNRNEFLIETNKTITKDTLIELAPLPSCGMLYSSEIQADTNHFTNKALRLGYDLKFHVIVENKK